MAGEITHEELFGLAYQKVAEDLYGPAFFEALRRLGRVPRTQKEAQRLLALGDQALAAQEQGLAEAAGGPLGPLERAEAKMASLLGGPGPGELDAVDEYIKLAAPGMAEDPDLLGALDLLARGA